MILAQLLYVIGLIPLAYWNAWRIKKDLRIYHALNCVYHFPSWFFIGVFVEWELLFALPFLGKFSFDSFLNHFRKLPFDYLPYFPKSKMDILEKRIFFNDGYFAKATYLALAIAFNVYYHFNG